MPAVRKVVVIGLDGLEPTIVEPMLASGELPSLARLRASGGYARCQTTYPAQTPVAWSTFATGVNPGGHGIFDFIRRDPGTYLPDLALSRYVARSAFLPPQVENQRRGTAVWEVLSDAGIPSTILRCPCTYPPAPFKGRMLAGMGVPDLRGGLGTATFYSSRAGMTPAEGENVVTVHPDSAGTISTHLIGPRNPKTGADTRLPMQVDVDRACRRVHIRTDGQPSTLEVHEGQWSDWLRVRFRLGVLQSVSGMVRFLLVRTEPVLELYVSPVNFEPTAPLFPISHPWDYAAELRQAIGTFYTTGMVEDHSALANGHIDEGQYLEQCTLVLREREQMMQLETERLREGLLFCLFDTPDRVQHMFWRFREPDHPANRGRAVDRWAHVIEDHYRLCDAIVGRALAQADDRTLVIVLSDHGFNSFQRGVHLNSWLHDHGFLTLQRGMAPDDGAGDLLRHVDWSRTQAYALGLGSIYLNLEGREADGIVSADDAVHVRRNVTAGLTRLRDADRGCLPVRGVQPREAIYHGPYAEESPDLVVSFAPGYRVSWQTALGGMPHGHLEDNVRLWSGDHIVDPTLVPGVLFMNRPFRGEGARLLDLAPTILAALGVPRGTAMEGETLI